MTANQFYVPAIAPDAAQIVLRGGEHRHLARTARVRAGEEVWLFDATGRRCRARVESVGRDQTGLAILKMDEPEAPRTKVALAQSLMEAEKFETVLEKAAELGCSDFIPIVSARSLKLSKERSDRKLDCWRRIAREAAKQSKGGWTEREENEIRLAGFVPLSLGRHILRAETAALVGALLIVHFWNE